MVAPASVPASDEEVAELARELGVEVGADAEGLRLLLDDELEQLDPAARARLRDELFTKYFETAEIDGASRDQLTAELEDFITCVRTGRKPRVSGEDARAAIILADRIVEKVRSHRWNGVADGPTGPNQLPAPLGTLITAPAAKREAA